MNQNEKKQYEIMAYIVIVLVAIVLLLFGKYKITDGPENSVLINLASELLAVAVLFFLFNRFFAMGNSEEETQAKTQELIANSVEPLKKLLESNNQILDNLKSSQQTVEKLEQRNKVLIHQRETLRNGIHILRDDHLDDRELAALWTLAENMQNLDGEFDEEAKKESIRVAISIACADRNFRVKEQESVFAIGKMYGLDEKYLNEVISIAAKKYPEISS